MGKKYSILIISFALSLCLSGCGGKPRKTVTVDLESNPSTGYAWSTEESEAWEAFFDIEDEFTASDSNLDGAAGVEHFTLTAKKPGSTTVDFVYEREWDKEKWAYKVSYEFTIDEKLNVEFTKKTVQGGSNTEEGNIPDFPEPLIK